MWDGVVPASLPSPTADLDVLNGIKRGGEGAPGGAAMADGVSVLEGADGVATAGGSDEYDRNDSFLADSGAGGAFGSLRVPVRELPCASCLVVWGGVGPRPSAGRELSCAQGQPGCVEVQRRACSCGSSLAEMAASRLARWTADCARTPNTKPGGSKGERLRSCCLESRVGLHKQLACCWNVRCHVVCLRCCLLRRPQAAGRPARAAHARVWRLWPGAAAAARFHPAGGNRNGWVGG